MDAFWTEEEMAFRRKAADYFLRRSASGPPTTALPHEIWRDLDGPPGVDRDADSLHDRISLPVSIIEEAAHHDPKLGHDLLVWRAASRSSGPLETSLDRMGRLAGTAAHVLQAGVRAARERGAFSSSLMDCREVQESLARLVSEADLIRLGACRLCRLLERGENERAGLESAGLDALGRVLDSHIRSVARSLLGESWIEAHLPGEASSSDDERTRS